LGLPALAALSPPVHLLQFGVIGVVPLAQKVQCPEFAAAKGCLCFLVHNKTKASYKPTLNPSAEQEDE